MTLFRRMPIDPLPAPQLRKDPIIDRWVIISTDRLGRPTELADHNATNRLAQCPFCAGNEHLTPPATYADPPGDSWQTRVTPNIYPAVRGDELAEKNGGLFQSFPAAGVHEVVVACPQHETNLARLPAANTTGLLRAFRERVVVLKRTRPELYPFIFSNYQAAAGASLEHAHAQLLAMPIVPDGVRREMEAAREYFRDKSGCVFCELLVRERHENARVVLETPAFTVLAAFAARFPAELWILPNDHQSHFEAIDDSRLAALGEVVHRVLTLLDRGLDDPPYNFVLHSAPPRNMAMLHYHWHIEILPRLTGIAGFECGTGMAINPVPPEQAARYLKQML